MFLEKTKSFYKKIFGIRTIPMSKGVDETNMTPINLSLKKMIEDRLKLIERASKCKNVFILGGKNTGKVFTVIVPDCCMKEFSDESAKAT